MNGGVRLGPAPSDAPPKPGEAAGGPGRKSRGGEGGSEDARAAGSWGYEAKLSRDGCGRETDPSCRRQGRSGAA